MKTTLRFSPNILAHLGEGLVPAFDQAIVELVKNSFDADASVCTVRVDDEPHGRCSISVEDDGNGMSASELRDGWLLVGSSSKVRNPRTRRFNRVAVGDKGLGRLAALRLGTKATLETTPRGSRSTFSVKIDWAQFHSAKSVDEVPLTISQQPSRQRAGTTIHLEGCPRFSPAAIRRLGRALTLVSDPFRSDEAFRVRYLGTALTRADVHFDPKVFSYSRYRIKASLSADRSLQVELLNKGERSRRDVIKGPFDTVPFTFELWVFPLRGEYYSAEGYPIGTIREWLSNFGGVHLYNGPIRIAPYGDRPVDWLDMNALRVASPEERPSTNNSIGRVVIDNSSRQIVQTTDRISFIENEPYEQLLEACREVLNWASRMRLREVEKLREIRRHELVQASKIQNEAMAILEEELSPEQYSTVAPAVTSAFDIRVKENEALRSDLMLYRAMATAGISSTVFSHEMAQPLGYLKRKLPELLRRKDLDSSISKDLGTMRDAVERLDPYVRMPLRYSQTARRQMRRIDLGESVSNSLEAFGPILDEQGVALRYGDPGYSISVQASQAMIDAIIGNLVTNSITAFKRSAPKIRRIYVGCSSARKGGRIVFRDNGGGIIGLAGDEVWQPGRSTTRGGTGFGLTIVRDTVGDIGGSVSLNPHARSGGAEFTITIPLAEES